MKRQRGRNNGRKPHMPQRGSQTFDSSGPDVRIRGNAYQVLEKYLALARDASAAGDRIAAENFYQHAEHYYRVISASGEHQRQQQQQQQQQHQNQMHGQGGHPHGGYGQGQPHQPQGQDPRQMQQPYDGPHQNGGYAPQGGHPHQQQPQQTHAQNPGPNGPGSDRQPN